MTNLGCRAFCALLCLLISTSAFADRNFREHRFSSFKILPEAKEGDIVFIGNSITNMMNWNELFGNRKNILNRGTSGCNTLEILDNLESMIAGHPSKVFLMIGTNDLATEGPRFTPEAVAFRINTILERIRREAPDAEVYFQSILPSSVGSRSKEKTELTNSLVEQRIRDLNDPKLVYIDLYHPLLEDGDIKNGKNHPHETAISFDGLHLSQKGYKVWADIIKDYVGYDCSLPDNAINYFGTLQGSPAMRASYFGALPVESNDILLFGDEFIHGGEWHELTGSTDFKDRGMGWGFPGFYLNGLNSILNSSLQNQEGGSRIKVAPKAVCIYGGTSEISKGSTSSATISRYLDVLDNLKSILPSTPIFVMTISPGPDSGGYNQEIVSFNKALADTVAGKENIHVIDLYSTLTDNDGHRIEDYFMGPASPYLNGFGYAATAREIVAAINETLATDYEALSANRALENLKRFNERTDSLTNRFTVFDNASSEVPYRIPAIAMTPAGDLVAVADYRHSKSDIGVVKNGKLDLKYRIKDAATGQWGEVMTLVEALGEGDDNIAFGDPCIVADRESNRVLVTSCSGNISFFKGTHENHQGWARFYSDDGGRTWSDYEEIGSQALNLLDQRSDGPVNAFFIGSGKITQSPTVKIGDYYRIYCAPLVRVNDRKIRVNYVFYSDDFGQNWHLLGDADDCPVPFGADEPKVEELPDGSVLISSRIKGGRFFNIFRFDDVASGSGKWGEPAVSNSEVNGLVASSNACNGETLCIPVVRNSDGAASFLLLQSVPLNAEGKRANVGINYKELASPDDYNSPAALAADWDGAFEVTPRSSAYSTMVMDKDNDVAFFFEENLCNGGFDLIYRKLSIPEITDGRYSARNLGD